MIETQEKRKCHEFDLRKTAILKKENKHLEYMNQIKNDLSKVLYYGHVFMINLDDTEQNYEEIFYPDIREFYSASCLPMQIWNIDEI